MQLFFTHLWSQFVDFIHKVPFINYGFGQNEGIWIHIIGAAILSKIIRIKYSYLTTTLLIFLIALVWEIIEFYIETPNISSMVAIYGTIARYTYDTCGDILGALIIAIITNYPIRSKTK
jgi:hypothetical protein